MSDSNKPTYFTSSTEVADLGAARFDRDTAAVGDRDFALISRSHAPVTVQSGRAPKGLESQVFAWNTFQYTTNERDEKEEKKGDLHEGQLHRQNRAAAGIATAMPYQTKAGSHGGGGGRSRRGGEAVGMKQAQLDPLCAGRKPEGNAPPLAKGYAEELDKSMFWDEPIC